MIAALAAFNCLGGRGVIPSGRLIFRCLLPALLMYEYTGDYRIGLAGLIGFGMWFPWEFGPGFMAITGRDSRTGSVWCRLADRLTGYSRGYIAMTRAQAKWYGTVFMTLRGACLYPLFLMLAYFCNPWAALIGIGVLSQGFCYRVWPETEYAVARAELLYGRSSAPC